MNKKVITGLAVLCICIVLSGVFWPAGKPQIDPENITEDAFSEGKIFHFSGETPWEYDHGEMDFGCVTSEGVYFLKREENGEEILMRADAASGGEQALCRLDNQECGFYEIKKAEKACVYLEYTAMKGGKPASVSILRYDLQAGKLESLGACGGSTLKRCYEIWENRLYWFTGFEGDSLEVWDGQAIHKVKGRICGDPDFIRVHDGIVGMRDKNAKTLLRYDLKKKKVLDQAKIADGLYLNYLQANDGYALWFDGDCALCAYCYKTGDILFLCRVADYWVKMYEKSIVELQGQMVYVIYGDELRVYDLAERKTDRIPIREGCRVCICPDTGRDVLLVGEDRIERWHAGASDAGT